MARARIALCNDLAIRRRGPSAVGSDGCDVRVTSAARCGYSAVAGPIPPDRIQSLLLRPSGLKLSGSSVDIEALRGRR